MNSLELAVTARSEMMLGPVTPAAPQVASSAVEPAQAAQPIRPSDDPRAGTSVELGRAPRPIPGDGGQRGIEGAIAAKENTIRMTEEVARRDRARLERYPAEMENLQSRIDASGDAVEQADLEQKLNAYGTALDAAQARLVAYETQWPDQRAGLETQISQEKTALAKAAYGQVPGTGQ